MNASNTIIKLIELKFLVLKMLFTKKKINYKTFLPQILYLKNKKKLSAKEIRKHLKISYSKGIIPSRNVCLFDS